MAALKRKHPDAASCYGGYTYRLIPQSDVEEGARNLPSSTALHAWVAILALSLKTAAQADRSGRRARKEMDQ